MGECVHVEGASFEHHVDLTSRMKGAVWLCFCTLCMCWRRHLWYRERLRDVDESTFFCGLEGCETSAGDIDELW